RVAGGAVDEAPRPWPRSERSARGDGIGAFGRKDEATMNTPYYLIDESANWYFSCPSSLTSSVRGNRETPRTSDLGCFCSLASFMTPQGGSCRHAAQVRTKFWTSDVLVLPLLMRDRHEWFVA
ncbi:hypothetical protein, partial [Mesorhizobium sp. B2-4-19]|uniref:hypothetical protein n=1 Tax=Mesorhizobium sp. B2-4-19 TaxID=2589930 RepID=UPI001AEEA8F5